MFISRPINYKVNFGSPANMEQGMGGGGGGAIYSPGNQNFSS